MGGGGDGWRRDEVSARAAVLEEAAAGSRGFFLLSRRTRGVSATRPSCFLLFSSPSPEEDPRWLRRERRERSGGVDAALAPHRLRRRSLLVSFLYLPTRVCRCCASQPLSKTRSHSSARYSIPAHLHPYPRILTITALSLKG